MRIDLVALVEDGALFSMSDQHGRGGRCILALTCCCSTRSSMCSCKAVALNGSPPPCWGTFRGFDGSHRVQPLGINVCCWASELRVPPSEAPPTGSRQESSSTWFGPEGTEGAAAGMVSQLPTAAGAAAAAEEAEAEASGIIAASVQAASVQAARFLGLEG